MSVIESTNKSERHDSPALATFIVFTYNQERYIREAILGAFAQDYRPLQVIVSDDASTDGTFAVMQAMAAECPSDIDLVLNRNETNLRIAPHINKAMSLARGEFVVLAAGDDVSLPQRTRVSVQALQRDPQARRALHSAVANMDADGNFIRIRANPHRDHTQSPLEILRRDVYLTGASVTVRKQLYSDFPPLSDDVVNEDKVTAFRCAFSGGAIYLEEPLVRYREGLGAATMGGAILTGRDDPEKELRYMRMIYLRRKQVLAQARVDCGSPALVGKVEAIVVHELMRLVKRTDQVLAFLDRPGFLRFPALLSGAGLTRKAVKIAVLALAPTLFRRYKLRRRR